MPDRVQEFGESRPALGELLALDGVHRLEIPAVILEDDGPLAVTWRRGLDRHKAHMRECIARDEDRVGRPYGRPILGSPLAGWHLSGRLQQFLGEGLANVCRDVVPF